MGEEEDVMKIKIKKPGGQRYQVSRWHKALHLHRAAVTSGTRYSEYRKRVSM